MHLPFQHRALPGEHRRRRRDRVKTLTLIPHCQLFGPPAPAELTAISPLLS